ncbi:HAD family hydrolase [Neobacillus sp. SM06]|uniref:HAD family hydrolase n=1 Tax=Neobacillus sp. SM06 TaxID=3422492 RepID=UPI003D270CD0
MMIIASDLDRTLIYSNRAIAELGCPDPLQVKPVEQKDGKNISYMTLTGLRILEEVCRKSMFIPVTTRTTDQFKRIGIFRETFTTSYVITTNGAEIYYKGEIIREWSEHLAVLLKQNAAAKEEVAAYFQNQFSCQSAVLRHVNDAFFYFVFDKIPYWLDKQTIMKTAHLFGWNASMQGRKLYFIPKPINKGDALSYICERQGEQAIAGAGDSILDWDFLARCKVRLIPRHGELANERLAADVLQTKSQGIEAGEEVLQQFRSLLAANATLSR